MWCAGLLLPNFRKYSTFREPPVPFFSEKSNQIKSKNCWSQLLDDYCIGSNFWKFYLIKTNFTLGEPVSLVKVFRLEQIVLVFRVWTQAGRWTTSYLLAGPEDPVKNRRLYVQSFDVFNFLNMVIYQTQLFDFLEPWSCILRTALIAVWGLFPLFPITTKHCL
jgi:hypothetical protein